MVFTLILQAVYFTVPAYFANMAPVIAQKLKLLPELNKPVDLGSKIDNIPLFGKNKTFRGFIAAIAGGILGAFIQKLLYNIQFFNSISVTDYSNWLLIGFLLGAGAITGDLVESFFKRRLKLRPGKPWIPFDQTDFIIGAYLFAWPFYYTFASFSFLSLFLTSFVASFFLHIATNHISYYLRIRKEKW